LKKGPHLHPKSERAGSLSGEIIGEAIERVTRNQTEGNEGNKELS
jgi:hypothetical protein